MREETGRRQPDTQKKKSNAGTASRLNTFYVLYSLYRHTDENHMCSSSEIVDLVRQDADINISDDTVERILRDLPMVFASDEEAEIVDIAKNTYGFCIRREKRGKTFYFYYDHSLSKEEITTLIEAVESYSFFSTADITPLVNKIASLRHAAFHNDRYNRRYDRYVDPAEKARIGSGQEQSLLGNIRLLLQAIRNDNRVQITYSYYNEKKELVSRKGYPREVIPVRLLWSNGFYYLQIFQENYQTLINLRIDRITEIVELEKKRGLDSGIVKDQRANEDIYANSVEYRNRHPVMYGGEMKPITMLCRDSGDNYIVNNVIDSFGIESVIREAGDQDLVAHLGHDSAYYAARGEKWLKVRVNATEGGTALWATQHCRDCEILSPDTVRDKVRENLEKGMDYYQKK